MKKVFILSIISISAILPAVSWAEENNKPIPPKPHMHHEHKDVEYTGKVLSFKTNRDNAYDGFILQTKNNKITVNFPPHMASKIMSVVKSNDTITVMGHTHHDKNSEIGFNKLIKGSQEVEHEKPSFKLPTFNKQVTDISGNIKEFTKGKKGEINGFYLGDNTIVHIPPRESAELIQNLKLGDNIKLKGYVKPLNESGFVYSKKVNIIDAISVTTSKKEFILKEI